MLVFIAITCYLLSWLNLLLSTARRQARSRLFTPCLSLALFVHCSYSVQSLGSFAAIELGFFQVASIIFLTMNIIVALSAIKLPLSNLFLVLLPFSIFMLLAETLLPEPEHVISGLEPAMVAHILLSITAYSLLTIATLQALFLSYQSAQLKSHHAGTVIGIFPPLQTMESLLFTLLWAGFALLSASILSGLLYLKDMFAQNLSHKLVFSIISWILYLVLLGGRQMRGWRGRQAQRFVIAAFVFLMLAYFGSKFVLEYLLNR